MVEGGDDNEKKISNKYTENTFENIKHIDEYGNEFLVCT